MSYDEALVQDYLQEVNTLCDGDPTQQTSMHEAGERLGLDRADASRIAEELMVQGLVELKTLAGGIGITAEGLATLGVSGGKTSSFVLGSGAVLSDEERHLVNALIARIRAETAGLSKEYEALEELVIDLKTLEVQLLSPRPKMAVVKALLKALGKQLKDGQTAALASELETAAG